MNNRDIIKMLSNNEIPKRSDLISLLNCFTQDDKESVADKAVKITKKTYGNNVFFRGLIEISNYCKNNCYYCGIRRDNINVNRYRLSKNEILTSCDLGHKQGIRTFVLQGGEDSFFTDEILKGIIKEIKSKYSDSAITLSLGERTRESYQQLFDAGADRYLLRHESITPEHYNKLHPKELSIESRKHSLFNLKEIGYQTGCGLMIGSPHQTMENIVDDLIFMKDFAPAMIGIGPFIPHKDTPFRKQSAGTTRLTLFLLSIIRLLLPKVLLPSTTALSTVSDNGIELGVFSGANVVMPNLTPFDARKNYLLYDNKKGTTDDTSESVNSIKKRLAKIGYEVPVDRGDYPFDSNDRANNK